MWSCCTIGSIGGGRGSDTLYEHLITTVFGQIKQNGQTVKEKRMTNLSREVKVNFSRGGGKGRGEGRWGTVA